MEVSLAGRTAVITGASKGIGFAIATRFAGSGADVAIIARGREALDAAVKSVGASGRRVVGIQADVAVAADVKRAYDEAMRALGKIDIVVNNAGTSATSPFEKLTDEFLQLDFDQKLFAAVRLSRLVWPQMKERRWGRIINVLNIGAKAPRGLHRSRSARAGGEARRRRAQGLRRGTRQGDSARPHRPRRGIRQHGVFPRIRSRLLHHR